MRWWLALVFLLVQTACGMTLRLTVGPTVDTFGHVGADVKVTAGVGTMRTGLLQPSVGYSRLGREGADALVVAPEIAYWMEPAYIGAKRRMPALRAGTFFSGHYFSVDGHSRMLNGLGANFAILPRLREWSHRDAHSQSHHFLHLGVEFSGEYGWGSAGVPDRGIFSMGLTIDTSLVKFYDD